MKQHSICKDLRGFLLLWGSQTVSELGTAMTDYALIVWVYGQKGTASSVTWLTICSFLPTILLRFAAGTLADRRDKKRVMLAADLFAACGTAAVFLLFRLDALRVWHLYLINILLSCMNAFQVPASFVATTLLVPKEHYARVGGLQGFSGSAVAILAPALGGLLLAWGGLTTVLICDLASFAVAFGVLLFAVRIPDAPPPDKRDEPFLRSCMEGVRYLRQHGALLRIALFLAAVNFLAKLGNDGMLAPFALGRTGGDRQALAMTESAVAAGLLTGSLLVTVLKPARRKTRVIFACCALVFCGNIALSLSARPWIWCVASFVCYLPAAVMNANWTAVMRERVPVSLQGRVFSAKDTLQNCTIPLGLFLGGLLADRVFEPFMAAERPVLSRLFGSGSGAGVGVIFFCVGVLGAALSLAQLRRPVYRSLDE